jgi:uncharacterized membrane protein
VVLYAFHNWDLLAVGFATLGIYAWRRGSDPWAGLLFGLGAATKLYPLFLLPAFVLASWRRDRRFPWAMTATFVGAVAVLNVPLMIWNYQGWKYPWNFQSVRSANFETSWYMIFRHSGETARWFYNHTLINSISIALFTVGALALLVAETRRRDVRPIALGFALVCWYLVTAKVFSPQYALWLLPFFVLLRLPLWSYAAFVVTDAGTWIAVSWFFVSSGAARAHALNWLEVAVWARYAVLIVLILLSRRSEELVREPGVEPEAAPVPLTA